MATTRTKLQNHASEAQKGTNAPQKVTKRAQNVLFWTI
jgi:hypothetical protein